MSTVLDSNLLEARRGIMLRQTSVKDYVQSGLILHLDGKTKGPGNYWYNIVGSGSFLRHETSFKSDHVYFDGVDDYLRSTDLSTSFFPMRTTGTIEVVYDNENFGISVGIILIGRANTRIGAVIMANKGFLYGTDNTSSRAYYYPMTTVAKATVSVSAARQIENGVAMEMSTATSYISGANGSYNYIGRRHSGDYFKGKIYSIRVYNRQLTEAEALHNQKIDNIRFNLGLTI